MGPSGSRSGYAICRACLTQLDRPVSVDVTVLKDSTIPHWSIRMSAPIFRTDKVSLIFALPFAVARSNILFITRIHRMRDICLHQIGVYFLGLGLPWTDPISARFGKKV